MIQEVEHCEIVESASREHSEIHFSPDIGGFLVDILLKGGGMPAEHLHCNISVQAGRMQAVDEGSLVGAGVIDQIVNLEGITGNSDDRVELGVDLPVAVVVVDIEKFDG